MAAVQLQHQHNNLEITAAHHAASLQQRAQEVINMEHLSHHEMAQRVFRVEEQIESDARTFKSRCEGFVNQEKDLAERCERNAMRMHNACAELEQERQMANQAVALYKNQVAETEQAARDSLCRAQNQTSELARMVMVQRNENHASQRALHDTEMREQQITQYYELNAGQQLGQREALFHEAMQARGVLEGEYQRVVAQLAREEGRSHFLTGGISSQANEVNDYERKNNLLNGENAIMVRQITTQQNELTECQSELAQCQTLRGECQRELASAKLASGFWQTSGAAVQTELEAAWADKT